MHGLIPQRSYKSAENQYILCGSFSFATRSPGDRANAFSPPPSPFFCRKKKKKTCLGMNGQSKLLSKGFNYLILLRYN